ncbi:MAG: cytochrome P460 family protein [Nitrospiraceae bacterium]|nr:MAG: cytochrome P460 family protein [Nitrospiraceae bacterium]
MTRNILYLAVSLLLIGGIAFAGNQKPLPAPNGITIPEGYKNWKLIASSHRSDNNTMRVVLGNDTAIASARSGKTNPWPEGSILAKLVWKNTTHEKWPTATIPGEFVHAEFMIKDTARYKDTGGWGFARWKGMEQAPYGEKADFVQECFGCHTPVKDSDYVFTHPAVIPE